MRCAFYLAALVAAVMQTAQARAQDYPFAGAFTTAGNPAAHDPDDIARCALSFFVQDKTGGYINYVVDMNGFNTTQTLRYLIAAKGTCFYDAAHKLESCRNTFDVDPANRGSTSVDVIDQITPDFIKITNFDTADHARDYYATGQSNGGFPTSYALCPFDPARLSAAISAESTRLPPDKTLALMSPDATLLHAPITADLVKAAGLSKP